MLKRFLAAGAASLLLLLACTPANPDSGVSDGADRSGGLDRPAPGIEPAARLPVPATGKILVAFVVSPGATVIDFAGPWEVFQDVSLPERGFGDERPFALFTVGPGREPIRATAGLQIVPDYTFEDAPVPNVIVVPAQQSTERMVAWIRSMSAKADLTMSVCTGAFVLADAGLLNGRMATTHHDFLDSLERRYPQVKVRRNVRYVEGPRIATAGGLTSGIDLALRVVARYFGQEAAERTASFMEHAGTGWHEDAGIWDGAPGPVR